MGKVHEHVIARETIEKFFQLGKYAPVDEVTGPYVGRRVQARQNNLAKLKNDLHNCKSGNPSLTHNQGATTASDLANKRADVQNLSQTVRGLDAKTTRQVRGIENKVNFRPSSWQDGTWRRGYQNSKTSKTPHQITR